MNNIEFGNILKDEIKLMKDIHAEGIKKTKKNKLKFLVILIGGLLYVYFDLVAKGILFYLATISIICLAIIVVLVYYFSKKPLFFPSKEKRELDNTYKNRIVRKGITTIFPDSKYYPFFKYKKSVFENSDLIDSRITQTMIDDCIEMKNDYYTIRIMELHLFDELYKLFHGFFITINLTSDYKLNQQKILDKVKELFPTNVQLNRVRNCLFISIPTEGKRFEYSFDFKDIDLKNTFEDFDSLIRISEVIDTIKKQLDSKFIDEIVVEKEKYTRATSITLSKRWQNVLKINAVAASFFGIIMLIDYILPCSVVKIFSSNAMFNTATKTICLKDYFFELDSPNIIFAYTQISTSNFFDLYVSPILKIPMSIDMHFKVNSIYNFLIVLLIVLSLPISQYIMYKKKKILSYPVFLFTIYISPIVTIITFVFLLLYPIAYVCA